MQFYRQIINEYDAELMEWQKKRCALFSIL